MKILVAVDESDYSRDAVEFITETLWKVDDEFMVLTVVEPLPVDYGMGLFTGGQEITQDYSRACDLVAEFGLLLREELPANKTDAKVLTGGVVDQICEYARRWNADMIVVGSHGRKGLQHFMLGSVAEEVLKNAPCTVEVIKHKKHCDESSRELAASTSE